MLEFSCSEGAVGRHRGLHGNVARRSLQKEGESPVD